MLLSYETLSVLVDKDYREEDELSEAECAWLDHMLDELRCDLGGEA